MVATKLTIGNEASQPQYRQTIGPNSVSGTYLADDQDDHDFITDARGKGRMTVSIDNPSNKDVTVVVYGTQEPDGEIADAATKQIGTFTATALNAAKNYETSNDPFPYYLVRCSSAATPDGSTVTVYVNLAAF